MWFRFVFVIVGVNDTAAAIARRQYRDTAEGTEWSSSEKNGCVTVSDVLCVPVV